MGNSLLVTAALVIATTLILSCGNHTFDELLGLDSSSSEASSSSQQEDNYSSSSFKLSSSSSSLPVANVSSDSHPGAVVGPLLKIKWAQRSPYNDLFPIQKCDWTAENGRVVTNCVTTAFVQIIGFHKYPARGKGESSILYSSCGHVDDLPLTSLNVAYDWNNMLDEYTSKKPGNEQQRLAVATLMYHFGLARGFGNTHYAQYDGDSDVNFLTVLRKIMVDVFGYDKSLQCLPRYEYSDAEWMAIIRKQLDLGLPVYLQAVNDNGIGHAFVIDGYDNAGKFHINPGWGGSYNGWYSLNDMDFSGTTDDILRGYYDWNHYICISIKPDIGNALNGTLTDSRDGKKYKTVKIGEQTWMAENLNIETGKSECYYDWDKDKTLCNEYGRLYDWATAKTACPSGWHLPNNAELEKLLRYADWKTGTESPYKSKSASQYLKAESGWRGFGISTGCEGMHCNGTDNFGFSALPGGYGLYDSFYSVGNYGYWWSASENNSEEAYTLSMGSSSKGGSLNSRDKSYLHSVRCIQGDAKNANEAEENAKKEAEEAEAKAKADEEKAKAEREAYIKANGGTFTDTRDSKTYDFVKIGNQTWLAENLKYEADGSKCYNNEPANCAIYGRLYDWSTAMALPSNCNSKESSCASQINAKHQGICPNSWHIPSDAEWNELMKEVGDYSPRGGSYPKAGSYLKAQKGWTNCGKGSSYLYQCEDTYAFSALPGAYGYSSGKFDNSIGTRAYYWSSTEGKDYKDLAYARYLTNSGDGENRNQGNKSYFYSVRCVKD